MAQLCGSELDGLTVSQLEELERMQTEAIRCLFADAAPAIALVIVVVFAGAWVLPSTPG